MTSKQTQVEALETVFERLFGEPTPETVEGNELKALWTLLIDHHYESGPALTSEQNERFTFLNKKLRPKFTARLEHAYGDDGDG